ncbi:hypothetical protein ACGYLM_18485 [Sulfitobacter sp. 1A10445]|uniref:hypothetical protein n=1 Tax=unclassified Sulfitobacter TaxID=196795 RepID=UPI003744EF25
MKRIAVIAQTADPARGSEFATGWGAIRDIYLDPRIRTKFHLDIYVSENGNNRKNILSEVSDLDPQPNFIFVPQVFPRLHRLMGRFLRQVWQFAVWRRIKWENYDIVHQVSPNSIAYLNPIFISQQQIKKIVGPMRAERKASVPGLYMANIAVMFRHLSIKVKETSEAFLFLAQRRAVARNAFLHLSPIASLGLRDNQIYCPETAFVTVPPLLARDGNADNWRVIWSGSGDNHRKNEHLAKLVVKAALQDPRLAKLQFAFIGGKRTPIPSSRVTYSDGINRAEFMSGLSNQTIYLLTSLLELNSVLAREVLLHGGQVVVGPLPSFSGRDHNGRVHHVEQYSRPEFWVDALVKATVEPSGNDFLADTSGSSEIETAIYRILKLA